jgi:hypothetical protein
VKVVIREAAARDLDDVLDWISKDNPQSTIHKPLPDSSGESLRASTGLRLPACLTSGVPACAKGHESW